MSGYLPGGDYYPDFWDEYNERADEIPKEQQKKNKPGLKKGNTMTKMHFEAMAKEIKESNRPSNEKAAAAHLFMRVAENFNPRFDKDRFWKACGLPDNH